jgi:hypothetical protein
LKFDHVTKRILEENLVGATAHQTLIDPEFDTPAFKLRARRVNIPYREGEMLAGRVVLFGPRRLGLTLGAHDVDLLPPVAVLHVYPEAGDRRNMRAFTVPLKPQKVAIEIRRPGDVILGRPYTHPGVQKLSDFNCHFLEILSNMNKFEPS